MTFGERHGITAAFLTFHQSLYDSISVVNLFQELILDSGYKWNKYMIRFFFFFFLMAADCVEYLILTNKSGKCWCFYVVTNSCLKIKYTVISHVDIVLCCWVVRGVSNCRI